MGCLGKRSRKRYRIITMSTKSKLKELFIKSRYLKGKSLSKKERCQIADGYLAMRRLGVWGKEVTKV